MTFNSSKTVLTILFSLAAVACAERRAPAKKEGAPAPPGGPKFALFQTSLLPGSTNSGPMPTLEFTAQSLSPETANTIAAQLEASLVFGSTHGTDRIGSVVGLRDDSGEQGNGDKAKEPRIRSNYTFTINPVSQLKDSKWYDAILASKIDSIVLAADDTYDLGPGVVTRFYTVSAPQVRRIDEVRKGGSPSRSVIVQMSEQVNASDLLSGGLDVVTEGSSRKGCVIWNDKCLEKAANNPIVTGFEYRMDADTPPKFALHLGLAVRGSSGKKVGDIVDNPSAVRAAATQSEHSLAYSFDKSAWRQRRSPKVFGWSNAE